MHGAQTGIVLQSLDLPPGAVHADTPPVSALEFLGPLEHPYDAAVRVEANRCARVDAAARQYSRQGGLRAIRAASRILKVFRRNFLSRSAQVEVLVAVNEMHDENLLEARESTEPAANRSPCLLPRTLEALERRGDPNLVQGEDINSRKVRFSTVQIEQQQQAVEMVIGDIPAYIQSILDDPRTPPGQFFFQTTGTHRSYTTEDGTPLFGPEIYHGKEWKTKAEAIPDGAIMLGIIVSSDGTIAQGGTRYPVRISVANQPLETRLKDAGSRLADFGPTILIRRPRGSKHHETLGRASKQAKRQILSAFPAHMLADLDFMASKAIDFRIWNLNENGDRASSRVSVHMRCLLYVTDKKEEQALLALSSEWCPRCLSHEEAIKREAAEGRAVHRDQLYHFRTDDLASCAGGHRRTVPEVVRRQVQVANVAGLSGVTASDALSKELCVRGDVEVMLHRLQNLFPHPAGPYSAFATDLLLVYGSGVAPKFILMLDAFVLKFHAKNPAQRFVTSEDVHNYQDMVLSSVPPFRGVLTFSTSWWASSDMGSVSSSESESLVQQMPLTYIANELMIPNRTDRVHVLAISSLLVELMREFTTVQWFTAGEKAEHSHRLKLLSSELLWMQLKLGDDCPGNGMNISKLHDFLNSGKTIDDFGSLKNACTGVFERRMKTLKQNGARVVRSRSDDRGGLLFDRQQSNELEAASPAQAVHVSGPLRGLRVTMGRRRLTLDRGYMWGSLVTDLRRGRSGPPLPEEMLENLDITLAQALGVSEGAEFFSQAQVVTTADDWVLMPGHCLKLTNGSFVQIIVAAPALGSRESAGPGLRFVVSSLPLVQPTARSGMHHEYPLLWLRRREALRVIPIADLSARAHVVRHHGTAGRPMGDTSEHFLVNNSHEPRFAGPMSRLIYLSCPYECGGRLLKPVKIGLRVECQSCHRESKWM